MIAVARRRWVLICVVALPAMRSAVAQGPAVVPTLAQAESLLAAGDTNAAVRMLTRMPLDPVITDTGVAATFALVWVGRSPKWHGAMQAFYDRTKPRLKDWIDGAPAAMVVEEDTEEGARWAWRADVTPIPGMADNLADELKGQDTAQSMTFGAMRWAVAQFDLLSVSRGLRAALPFAGYSRYGGGDDACTEVRSPWVGLRGVRGNCRPPSLAALVAADSELALHLARARQLLHSALHDPWPFNELSARVLVALELNFGDSTSLPDLLQRVSGAELNEPASTAMRTVLLGLGGQPDRAAALMARYPGRFDALDSIIKPLENRAHVSAGVLWGTGWPLYLEPWNERLVVHRARVLAADLVSRWTPPGLIQDVNPPDEVIRRGFPVAVDQMVQRDGRGTKVAKHLYYDGRTTETILPASEQSDANVAADVSLAATAPVTDQAVLSGFVPAYYNWLLDFPHQVMRYQRNGKPEVDFFAQPPPQHDSGCQYERGLFLLSAHYAMLLKVVDTAPLGHASRQRYTVPVAPGSYVYSLEVRDTTCRVAARARHTMNVAPVGEGLAMSDVLLADGAVPLEPTRVDGAISVVGKGGLEVRPDTPVSLYWEVYGVSAAEAEPDRLAIGVEAVDIVRGQVPVSRIGHIQHVADTKRADAALRYPLAVPPGDGALGIGVTLQMPPVRDAVVRIRVTVTDQATGKRATGTRTFRVTSTAN